MVVNRKSKNPKREMRLLCSSIASILLLNEAEVKAKNLILIQSCIMVKRLERKENFYSSNVWPSCLQKFIVCDDLGNILVCYFYEIDCKMPVFQGEEQVHLVGVFEKKENSFGDSNTFHCYKIAKNEKLAAFNTSLSQ